MNYDDSHELMRIFESIVQNDPELQMEEFGSNGYEYHGNPPDEDHMTQADLNDAVVTIEDLGNDYQQRGFEVDFDDTESDCPTLTIFCDNEEELNEEYKQLEEKYGSALIVEKDIKEKTIIICPYSLNESDDNNKPLTWDEICSAVEGDLINNTKVKDDVHSKNPNVKTHDGQPRVQGMSNSAKEIEGSKFYYGKEPKSVDEAVYFLWQIVKLYCGTLKLPSGVDCSDMYVEQYNVDARKMASYISGRLMTNLDLDCGWSSNTTNSILKCCVEYMRQSKPRDPSKLVQVLQSNDDRRAGLNNRPKTDNDSSAVNEDNKKPDSDNQIANKVDSELKDVTQQVVDWATDDSGSSSPAQKTAAMAGMFVELIGAIIGGVANGVCSALSEVISAAADGAADLAESDDTDNKAEKVKALNAIADKVCGDQASNIKKIIDKIAKK